MVEPACILIGVGARHLNAVRPVNDVVSMPAALVVDRLTELAESDDGFSFCGISAYGLVFDVELR